LPSTKPLPSEAEQANRRKPPPKRPPREALVHSIADIYDLKREQLLTLERIGEKSRRLLSSNRSNRSKQAPLKTAFFWASAFRHVGERTAADPRRRVWQYGR